VRPATAPPHPLPLIHARRALDSTARGARLRSPRARHPCVPHRLSIISINDNIRDRSIPSGEESCGSTGRTGW
jgi:hypothetical protein